MNNGLFLLIALFFTALSAPGSQLVGASTAGLGGAGTAAVENIDSLYLNPAALASNTKLNFGSGYIFGSLVPGVSRETYSITMSDGSPGVAIPGAFGYRYHRVGIGEQTYREQEFRGGFALRLHRIVSLGLGLSHISSQGDVWQFRQKNADVGLLVNVKRQWGLSLVAEGLVKPKDNLPEALRRQTRWGLGSHVNVMRILDLRYDVKSALHNEVNGDRFVHRVGLGFLLRGFFQLNFGASFDDILEQNWLTTGVVFTGPKLKVGYSIQNEDRMGLGMRHFVDLWLDL